jgi:hypothetical protein
MGRERTWGWGKSDDLVGCECVGVWVGREEELFLYVKRTQKNVSRSAFL